MDKEKEQLKVSPIICSNCRAEVFLFAFGEFGQNVSLSVECRNCKRIVYYNEGPDMAKLREFKSEKRENTESKA